MRPILLVGGAPRVAIDAVRYLTVAASGATACALHQDLAAAGVAGTLLLSRDAQPGVDAVRYGDRAGLDGEVRTWIASHPEGVVVLSAAINDYQADSLAVLRDGRELVVEAGTKAPSGSEGLVIRLRPAPKLIDNLRGWGHRGPLVGFKYEDAATVIASAAALRRRCGARVVVANSLCGTVQALVDDQVESFADRQGLVAGLVQRLLRLVRD